MKERYSSRISELVTSITNTLPKRTNAMERQFVEQFYQKLPLAELEHITGDHSLAIAQDAYRFFIEHQCGTSKIRAFYPSMKEHGYDTSRLVMQFINDDQPFLVDSIANALNHLGLKIHIIIHPILAVSRDSKGKMKELLPEGNKDAHVESFIHVELSALPEGMTLEDLRIHLDHVLEHVRLAIQDWKTLLSKTVEARDALTHAKHYNEGDIFEAQEFLDWIRHRNFVYLGYVGVDFSGDKASPHANINKDTALGISKVDDVPTAVHIGPQLVDVRKASRYSKVHRHALMDVVTVKRIDADGNELGEHRFYGLFTSSAYYQDAMTVPLVRRKVERLLKGAGFVASSHNGKALAAIMQFMPRDELFQMQEDDLFTLSMGLLALEQRPGVKLFARIDLPRRYISTLVYVPRELFSTDVRRQVTQTLENHFHAKLENYETLIGESPLARLHITLRTSGKTPDNLDIQAIEKEIATTIMLWSDRLKAALFKRHDSVQAERLYHLYANAFDDAYISRYPILSAVYDISKMESSLTHQGLDIELYHERDEAAHVMHIKIYNVEQDIALSDILPQLEHMGLRVVDEFPYIVQPKNQASLHIRDIRVELEQKTEFSLAQVKPNFEELLLSVWQGKVGDDPLNALVFHAGLDMQQIEIIRACYQYLRQVNFTYGKRPVARALLAHPDLALLLVQLFEARFDPEGNDRENKTSMISSQLEQGLSRVDSLQEDRIIDTLHQLIRSIVRTNYYLRAAHHPDGVLSFKIDSSTAPNVPLPKPFMEIFVYSARVEGVHLRGGKVARGGLRWSDRPEDFRTEVLGLMKAQMVKNAVIVPVGSKGGFVVKQVSSANRDAFREEGIECYKAYLRGMLDITDNVIDGAIVPPAKVVRYDGDDPYLVVAADKGTATFSDTANGISADYGFWLDDAFASGGSVGYDHKAMGITARGAWVSVQRHFSEMDVDIHTTPFTVAGIGDMSGDVFGNGMLLSENIKLVAAFNHMHIFLDPTPNPETSFAERKRLFEMPRSSWTDYDEKLISQGGGIFERSAKHITLSPEAQAALGADQSQYAPDELIKIILKAPVDLLWNGGIGTYVKATFETDESVGDRANNSVRINGRDIRAKIVGEGGNLGLTQQGRIEYARAGGRINTDAIDNSAGVDCSDHEVNIKIALKKAVASKEMSMEARNVLLESMTDEVASLVLRDNQLQTQAITIEERFAAERLPQHMQLMRTLEARGLLDRTIEFLPDDVALAELKQCGQGLTRPEIAVLLAYSKIALFADVVDSSMPDEPYFASDLQRYFPKAMHTHDAYVQAHSLKREIIGTVATNSMVNRAGISFYFDILQDTQMPTRDVVVAYSLARDVLCMRELWSEMEQVASGLPVDAYADFYDRTTKLLKHATFWLLRHRSLPLDTSRLMEEFCAPIKTTMDRINHVLHTAQLEAVQQEAERWKALGLEAALADKLAALSMLNGVLDIAVIAHHCQHSTEQVGSVYFELASELKLYDLIAKAADIATDNRWDRLAQQSLTHDFYDQLARITRHVFDAHQGDVVAFKAASTGSIDRLFGVLDDMLSREQLSSPMMMVALQQLKQVAV